ncbi:MAG: thiamine pyrophosphate-dependent enzyme [Patescibacteria group bacterium]
MNDNNQNSPSKFCAGCGHPIVLLALGKTLEEMGLSKQAVLGLDIGCSLLAINFLPINTFHTHHGRVSPTMVGFKKARQDSICLGYTGDGGAYAIGLQSLLHSAKRDEPITVLVVNNTVYAMTGGQTAPTTLIGQKTITDPEGCKSAPILGPELIRQVANTKAFLARVAVNDIKQAREFIKKAIETQQAGHFSLVEFLSFCPTNWRTKGRETLEYLENLKKVFKIGEI